MSSLPHPLHHILSNSVCNVSIHFAPPSSLPRTAVGYSLLASSPWAPFWLTGLSVKPCICYRSRVRRNSKYKIQAFFEDPKVHFSSTKIIDKKPYPRRGHSKFRLQCDTKVYCTVLIKASDRLSSSIWLLQNCQQMQNFKSARFKFKDFQAPYMFSSTFKGLKVFIPNSSIFKDFSSMLWTLQKIPAW